MERYPAGAQCWVEVLHPDPDRARDFYSTLFGWEVADGVARVGGRAVAGIGPGPQATWITRVRATRVALLTDPGGALFGMCEDGPVAEIVNEPASWDLCTLHTDQPERAIAFYGSLLGWQAEPFGAITLWRLPGYVGGIPNQPVPRDTVAIMRADGTSPARWEVDFRVRGADEVADRCAELGGEIVEPPRDTPGFRSAVLADPRGATFSITQFL
jgi:predicted enzyme related to lactoylglutathione lyase